MDTHFCRTPAFPSLPFFFFFPRDKSTAAENWSFQNHTKARLSGWNGGQLQTPRVLQAGELSWEERLRELGLSNLERKRLRETLSRGINIWLGRQGKTEQDSSQWCLVTGQAMATNKTTGKSLYTEENTFYSFMDGKTLEQVVQRGCKASSLGVTQNPN